MARPYVKDLVWPKITPLPKNRWLVDTGVRAGKRMRKKFATEKEAIAWADSFKRPVELNGQAALTDTQRHQHVLADHMLKSNGFTTVSVVDAVNHYLRFMQVSGKSPKVSEAVHQLIESHQGRYKVQLGVSLNDFLAAFGEKKAADIDGDELRQCIFKRTDIKETTRHNHYRAIQTFFAYCKDSGWIEKSPLQKRHIPKVGAYNPQILTIKDAAKLLMVTTDPKYENMRLFMGLALFCGIRIQELCRLKYSDIVWNSHDKCHVVLIGPHIGKKNRARNVPVPANCELWIIDHLKAHTPHPIYLKKERCDYVLPGEEGGVSYRLREIAKKAGVTMSQNIMRHSFASYYYELTRDAEQTRYRLGHNTPDVLFTHYRQLVTGTTNPFDYFKICPPKYGMDAHLNGVNKKMADIATPTPEALRILHLL